MMVRMVSEASHVYAGRALKAGDEFDCEPQHVDLMKILKRARVQEDKKHEPQVYLTREMKAGSVRSKRKRQ